MGLDRDYDCPNCAATIRTAMIRCRECGELAADEYQSFKKTMPLTGGSGVIDASSILQQAPDAFPESGLAEVPADGMILDIESDDDDFDPYTDAVDESVETVVAGR